MGETLQAGDQVVCDGRRRARGGCGVDFEAEVGFGCVWFPAGARSVWSRSLAAVVSCPAARKVSSIRSRMSDSRPSRCRYPILALERIFKNSESSRKVK